ncbi:hypothetical protein [Sciscionella marina]|uniref:hypothetical protein n=1 Tax=Sciscionella marina TaxID=508770 RepID=UPI00058CE2A5|nr:hypothetical protein [Sciscionella marina]
MPNPTDPADLRLLALLAEEGKGAVHEFAARLGMDPREVATRLINLSASGLPLVVGAECDQQRLRGTVAAAKAAQHRPQYPGNQYPGQQYPGQPHPGYARPGHPTQPPPGSYPAPNQAAPNTAPGPYPAQTPGPRPVQQPGPYPQPGAQSGPYPASAPQQAGSVARIPAVAEPPAPQEPPPADPLSIFGPPQSAAWARGDEPAAGTEKPAPSTPDGPAASGKVGERLDTTGLEGDPISVRLVEVVDPADALYTAAGYTLGGTERAVVVHTELTNRGSRTYQTLPDQYLMLYTAEGHSIAKAAISLSSRPPHTMGVPPGETVGGHAVYILNERTRVLEIRWLARPDSQRGGLTWEL